MKSNICEYCSKSFVNSFSKRRHLKTIHKEEVPESNKNNHIYCPLCKEENQTLGTYENFNKHLLDRHEICIEGETITCANTEEYEKWANEQKLQVNYTLFRKKKMKDLEKIYYMCNRSNSTGHTSTRTLRTEKVGGSVKIQGVCPSRLVVKFFQNGTKQKNKVEIIVGQISIDYFKTHVGHEEEIRSQHLTQKEKLTIVEKLKMGVTVDRILEDAREYESEKLTRMNMLNRKNINYLSNKYKIQKKRHECDMVAEKVKIEDWNSNGKNYAFLLGILDTEAEKCLTEYLPIQEPTRKICHQEDKAYEDQRKGLIIFERSEEIASEEVHNYVKNRLRNSWRCLQPLKIIWSKKKTIS